MLIIDVEFAIFISSHLRLLIYSEKTAMTLWQRECSTKYLRKEHWCNILILRISAKHNGKLVCLFYRLNKVFSYKFSVKKVLFQRIDVLCFGWLHHSYITNFNRIGVIRRYCKLQFPDQAFLSIIFTLNVLLGACEINIVGVFVRLRYALRHLL